MIVTLGTASTLKMLVSAVLASHVRVDCKIFHYSWYVCIVWMLDYWLWLCYSSSAACNYGDVRLANGPTTYSGRVEVCIRETWSTVCDIGWAAADANVLCRQLGFSRYSKFMHLLCIHGSKCYILGCDLCTYVHWFWFTLLLSWWEDPNNTIEAPSIKDGQTYYINLASPVAMGM